MFQGYFQISYTNALYYYHFVKYMIVYCAKILTKTISEVNTLLLDKHVAGQSMHVYMIDASLRKIITKQFLNTHTLGEFLVSNVLITECRTELIKVTLRVNVTNSI